MRVPKWLFVFFIAALLLSTSVRGEDDDEDDDEDDEEDVAPASDVLQLTDASFEEVTKANKYVLVAFTAPWCGHCKALKEPYAAAAAELKTSNPDVKLANIDATEHTAKAEEFGVRGYPTIKWVVDGEAKDYSGGRTADEIVAWIKKKTGPPAAAIADQAALDKFKEDNEVGVVGFFTADGAEKEAFLKQAAGDDDTAYGIVTDAALAKAAGASTPGVILFKQFDEKQNTFDGAYDAEALSKFVSSNSVPTLMEFNDDNVRKIFGSPIEHKALLFVDTDASDFEATKGTYETVAKENKGKLVFAYVNKDKSQVLEYFGIDAEKDLPVFFVLKMDDAGGDMIKYKHSGDVAGLGAFVSSYLAGDVKPHLKSEPAPENDTDENGLTTVVGSTIERILSQDKDVLIEFYAPWCGHCKSLAPKYKKLAKRFKDIDSVVIAQGDATASDFLGLAGDDGERKPLAIEGFPTILFWPAGAKEPVNYDGARSVKGMIKFLKENAKNSFELPKKEKKNKEEDDSAKEDL